MIFLSIYSDHCEIYIQEPVSNLILCLGVEIILKLLWHSRIVVLIDEKIDMGCKFIGKLRKTLAWVSQEGISMND